MKHNTYIQKEVLDNIEILNNKVSILKLKRTELLQSINTLKKQISEWQKLNKNQYKMFD